MVAEDETRSEPFRFRVQQAFVLTGRGTVVAGYIEQGAGHVGSRLRLVRGLGGPTCALANVASMRVANWKAGDPVLVGLLLPELDATQVAAGDFIVSADEQ